MKFRSAVMITLSYLLLYGLNTQLLANEAKTGQQVLVVTEINPPYVTLTESGSIGGVTTKLVSEVLNQAGLDHQIRLLPWKRALEQNDHQTLMVYPLARIPNRENEFHWLVKLHEVEIKLYGLRAQFPEGRADVKEPQYRFVCGTSSVLCAALDNFGVPESSITVLGMTNGKQMINMVQKGRVDFLATTPDVLLHNLDDMNIDRDTFTAIDGYVFEIEAYLAANGDLDPALVTKLQKAQVALSGNNTDSISNKTSSNP